jgi:hypothetical protein
LLDNLSIAPYRGLMLAVTLGLLDEPNGGCEKTAGAASTPFMRDPARSSAEGV